MQLLLAAQTAEEGGGTQINVLLVALVLAVISAAVYLRRQR
jgi:hypothetical protein